MQVKACYHFLQFSGYAPVKKLKMLSPIFGARVRCWLMFSFLSAETLQVLLPSQSVPTLQCCKELFLPKCKTSYLSLLKFINVLETYSSSPFRMPALPINTSTGSPHFGVNCKFDERSIYRSGFLVSVLYFCCWVFGLGLDLFWLGFGFIYLFLLVVVFFEAVQGCGQLSSGPSSPSLNLQGWRWYNLSGQPVPMTAYIHLVFLSALFPYFNLRPLPLALSLSESWDLEGGVYQLSS